MKLRRNRQRVVPETIVALIDVVFFLLVFFMLIGRMDASSPFEVAPPLALSGADMPAGGATVSIGLDGALALDGFAIERAAVLAALSARLDDSPQLLIRINAHKDTALRRVMPLISAIEALGAQNVALVVTPAPLP